MSFNSELQYAMFSPDDDFNFQEIQYPLISSIHTNFNGAEDWGDLGANPSFFFDYGYCQDEHHLKEQHRQPNAVHGMLGDNEPQYGVVPPPPLEVCLEEITPNFGDEPRTTPNVGHQDVGVIKKGKEYPFSLAALELLNNYGSGFKRLKGEKITDPFNYGNHGNDDDKYNNRISSLSTEEILRIAGARFIQSFSQQENNHHFGWSFSGLSHEETKDVELLELLLASAEKVESQQYESASRLINLCDHLSSKTGNPVQRVVYYFSEALKDKIDREIGKTSGGLSKGLEKRHQYPYDTNNASLVPGAPRIAFHQGLPLYRAEKGAGVQAILERIAEAKKVHAIDLRLSFGTQWTTLMQALASRSENPIELLKITAVGTTTPRHYFEETGRWLENFAYTMKIPFSFKVVMVEDMLSLKEELFELDAEETIAVYSPYVLKSMLAQPTQLESLMRVIRNLNPCIMVVTEVEANHNSPAFVNRFIEALFFYGAFFDYLAASMKHDDTNRGIFESLYCGLAIRNTVATEGEERKVRYVQINVWRAFFARFGMEELELSPTSIYQAQMAMKDFPCRSSCTLDMNGKCLMMGWKGTPLNSLSTWKFL